MNEYDIALKSLLRRTGGSVLRQLTGLTVERWHNVELSGVRQRNVDLLGESAEGRLAHIELQSLNSATGLWISGSSTANDCWRASPWKTIFSECWRG